MFPARTTRATYTETDSSERSGQPSAWPASTRGRRRGRPGEIETVTPNWGAGDTIHLGT